MTCQSMVICSFYIEIMAAQEHFNVRSLTWQAIETLQDTAARKGYANIILDHCSSLMATPTHCLCACKRLPLLLPMS